MSSNDPLIIVGRNTSNPHLQVNSPKIRYFDSFYALDMLQRGYSVSRRGWKHSYIWFDGVSLVETGKNADKAKLLEEMNALKWRIKH